MKKPTALAVLNVVGLALRHGPTIVRALQSEPVRRFGREAWTITKEVLGVPVVPVQRRAEG